MSDGPAVLFYAVLMILPITTLVARRVPAAMLIKSGMVWMAIFGLGMIAISAAT